MSLDNIQPVQDQGKSGGGGLWGTIGAAVGGLAALVAAPFTMGSSLAALPAAAGLVGTGIAVGNTVGSIAGNIADPATAGGISDVIPGQAEGSPLRSMSSMHPEVQLAHLADASKAIGESTLPAPQANQYMQHISDAMDVLRQRRGIGA